MHPINGLRNFSRFLAPGDLMHTRPLGVLDWFLGAILWELTFDGIWSGSDDERLQELWEAINFEYQVQNTKNRLSMLTLSMFYHGQQSFTCFTGKAGEALGLLYVLREICADCSENSVRDLHRQAALSAMCNIFDKCKCHSHFLPTPVAEEVLTECDKFLVHYNALARYSCDRLRLN